MSITTGSAPVITIEFENNTSGARPFAEELPHHVGVVGDRSVVSWRTGTSMAVLPQVEKGNFSLADGPVGADAR